LWFANETIEPHCRVEQGKIMASPIHLSRRARQTGDQPISYFMQQAVENPRLISLAAGLVDTSSLPTREVHDAIDQILSRVDAGRAALQYGTTEGHAPLREKVLARTLAMDGCAAGELHVTLDDVIVTTGSQQLLYLVGEALLDPGDIIITEGPSYFVYHGALASLGVRTLSVPVDEQGLITDALAEMLARLQRTGEIQRLRMIYVCDYFQNPTSLTLSLPRRQQLLELVRRYSRSQRIFILEDAAYRELHYDGTDVPSIKSFDENNEHVILAMTFSKPLAPGLKCGYGILPRDLAAPLLRLKGCHDFGSSNLNQHLIDHLLQSGAYDRHLAELRDVYRVKRDAMLDALSVEFAGHAEVRWTNPEGGLYVWLALPPGTDTGPDAAFMKASLRQGVLYVPGRFCYVSGENGTVPTNEARLSFGVASPEQIREAIRRLAWAYAEAFPSPRLAPQETAI
jgi:2-aminoadipate transaminase